MARSSRRSASPVRPDRAPRALQAPPILLFDGACRFCTWATRWLQRRLVQRVAMVPWQEGDLGRLGLTRPQVEKYVWWIGTDGERCRGHRAAARVLSRCIAPWPRVARLLDSRALAPLAAAGYWAISASRRFLPGVRPVCAEPRRCAR